VKAAYGVLPEACGVGLADVVDEVLELVLGHAEDQDRAVAEGARVVVVEVDAAGDVQVELFGDARGELADQQGVS